MTGFWKTDGPPEDLYSARKLFWDKTLWQRDGIWRVTHVKLGEKDQMGSFWITLCCGILIFSLIVLTERNAWTMSALIELRGLSRIRTKICSSFSELMKFPNQDLLASLQMDQWIIYRLTHNHNTDKHKTRTVPDNTKIIYIKYLYIID